MYISRRKFIKYLVFLVVPFIGLPKLYQTSGKVSIYDIKSKKKILEIKEYNKLREEELSNNFQKVNLEDYKKNRTIWIEKQLMSYAQLFYSY